MKKTFNVFLVFGLFLLVGCNNTAVNPNGQQNTNTSNNGQTNNVAQTTNKDLYFDFTVDGKEMHVDDADILTTYDEISGNSTFKIFAGKDGETSLLVTIPENMSGPSSTPNGSTDYDDNITQGSVSLLNFPAKNYTTNSFDTTYPETPVDGAVVVTSVEKGAGENRIITGTINVKTLGGGNIGKDPNVKDHVITGKFRVEHDFKGFGI